MQSNKIEKYGSKQFVYFFLILFFIFKEGYFE